MGGPHHLTGTDFDLDDLGGNRGLGAWPSDVRGVREQIAIRSSATCASKLVSRDSLCGFVDNYLGRPRARALLCDPDLPNSIKPTYFHPLSDQPDRNVRGGHLDGWLESRSSPDF